MFGITLDDIRKSMAGLFGVSALLCLWKFISLTRWLNEIGYDFLQFRSLYLTYFPALAAVNVMAWLTVWKDRRGSRIWGIAASLICIGLPARRIMHFNLPIWSDLGGLALVGVACLIAFLWPSGKKPTSGDPEPEEKAA